MTNWTQLEQACQQAMQAAAEKPGRYGGRHVGRRFNQQTRATEFVVLDDDDWDLVPEDVDVLAQCTPECVNPIGPAARYLREDGTVNFGL